MIWLGFDSLLEEWPWKTILWSERSLSICLRVEITLRETVRCPEYTWPLNPRTYAVNDQERHSFEDAFLLSMTLSGTTQPCVGSPSQRPFFRLDINWVSYLSTTSWAWPLIAVSINIGVPYTRCEETCPKWIACQLWDPSRETCPSGHASRIDEWTTHWITRPSTSPLRWCPGNHVLQRWNSLYSHRFILTLN